MYEKKYFTFKDEQRDRRQPTSHDYEIQVGHDVGNPWFQLWPHLSAPVVSRQDPANQLLIEIQEFWENVKKMQYVLLLRNYLNVSNAQFH